MKSSDHGIEEGEVKNGTSNKVLSSVIAKVDDDLVFADGTSTKVLGSVVAKVDDELVFTRVEMQSAEGDGKYSSLALYFMEWVTSQCRGCTIADQCESTCRVFVRL